jgi:MFS family permease
LSAKPIERRAVASLIVVRIVYAVNWLNIGALFYLMSADLNSGVSGLGALTASFYLGVGLMQIPGGVLAAKWGPKRTVTTGIIVPSLAVLATSFSTSLTEVVVLRFVVGSGMAMVFSPTVVLATRFLGGRSGFGAGLINSAFDVGGLLGLFGWILIASATGWRSSLVLSGALGLITGLLFIVLVPKDLKDNRFMLSGERLGRILKDRNLVLLGLGALGSNLGSVLISSFMVFYLHSELGEIAEVAGFVAALVVILPIVTSLWGGRLYDRMKKPRRLLISSGLGMVIALIVCSVPTTSAASLGAFVGGIAVGPASTVAFAAAKDLSGVEREYESLTIGWVNCISLTGSVWPPIVFSYLARSSGYSVAWLGGAFLSLILVIPILFLTERVSAPR